MMELSIGVVLIDIKLMFCSKLINLAEPGTIDERAINKKSSLNVYQKTENMVLFPFCSS